MDLAVFAVDLVLDAHAAVAKRAAVLDAPRLEPVLPTHFDAQPGFYGRNGFVPEACLSARVWQHWAFSGLQGVDGSRKVVLNLQYCRQNRVTALIDEPGVEDQWPIVLEDKPGKPFCLLGVEPPVDTFQVASVASCQTCL